MLIESRQGSFAPIAVIGIACRFPGEASSPEKFWQLLQDGKSAVSQVPSDRFNVEAFQSDGPGKTNIIGSRFGHFLTEDVAAFDAPFFNITANEAGAMDPQQRLLLEVSFEAFENAGVQVEKLVGSDTGTFVGCFTKDYSEILAADLETSPQYAATGTSAAILSNRISWFFNLKGPSLTLDTACSSSLVGVHLACQSLHSGESKMAIVGGSNLILNPNLSTWLSNLNMLAEDGLSKAFDSRANGYGRGEGIAAVVLKPLAVAVSDGDVIRAVIRGTGVNQDGKTAGITLPSALAQADLIRSTYARAGLDFSDTRYFEAHGTGTPVGDPIELEAISETLGKDRAPGDEIVVGSVKTNLGHLEGAAGLAGLIKTVLIVERGQIPSTLHFESPQQKVLLQEWGLKIASQPQQWPTSGLRRASVNSFGFGGTNAHVIIEDAAHSLSREHLHGFHCTTLLTPLVNGHCADSGVKRDQVSVHLDKDDTKIARSQLFVLSAHDRNALTRMKANYASHLQYDAISCEEKNEIAALQAMAYTLDSKRSRFPWKTYCTAKSKSELLSKLSNNSEITTTSISSPRLAFIFTGQGAQWARMGVELLRYNVFAQSVHAADRYLSRIGSGWSLLQELLRPPQESKIIEARFSQPVCTVIQIALVKLLRSWNITPKAVAGHSSGEIAAAYCCGTLSDEEAWKIAYYRGYFAFQIPDIAPSLRGRMLAVGLSEAEARLQICRVQYGPQRVKVAAINSPVSVTVSGDADAVDELHEILKLDKIFARELKIDNAYHSHHMEVIAERYRQSIEDIGLLTPEINGTRMSSSVTGDWMKPGQCQADYWRDNLVSPVRFLDAISNLFSEDQKRKRRANKGAFDTILEIGPHPALQGPVRQILEHLSVRPVPYHSMLSRGKSDCDTTLDTAGLLFALGVPVDVRAVNTFNADTGLQPYRTDLPPYPWDHSQSYWHESRLSRNVRFRKHPRHDLLGTCTPSSHATEPQWRNVIRVSSHPWTRDHVIQGSVLYPAAGLILMVVEAARQIVEPKRSIERFELRDVRIDRATVVPDDDEGTMILLSVRPRRLGSRSDSAAWQEFVIFSESNGGASLNEICSGLLSILYKPSKSSPQAHKEKELEAQKFAALHHRLQRDCQTSVSTEEFYSSLSQLGLSYGPSFRNVTHLQLGSSYCCFTIATPDGGSYFLHPATLDSMFQTAFSGFGGQKKHSSAAMVPTFVESISFSGALSTEKPTEFVGYASTSAFGFREIKSDIIISETKARQPRIVVKGLRCTQISAEDSSTSSTSAIERKKVASCYVWKPDLELSSPEHIERFIQKVSTEYGVRNNLPSIEKFELVAYLYIKDLLKIVAENDLRGAHIHLLREWMRTVAESKASNPAPPQMSGRQTWADLRKEDCPALFQELRSSGAQGEALCAIGDNLAKIVRGEMEPLQLLLENDLLYRFYRDAQEMKVMNAKLNRVLELISHKKTDLSIVEIGAGTGGTTKDVVSALTGTNGKPHSFAHYAFTDIGSAFCEEAAAEFDNYGSCMSFKILDIEVEPNRQGFEEGTTDIVIASNVLHATKSIDQTLLNVAKLLKPGGKLCLTELTQKRLWTGLIFGCLPQWWSGEADGRYGGPLLSVSDWNDALLRNGFTGVDLVCHDSDLLEDRQLSLIVSTLRQETCQRAFITEGVVILEPEEITAQQELISTKLLQKMTRQGALAERKKWSQHAVENGKNYIVLMELTSPLLATLAHDDFLIFKILVDSAASILWVSTQNGDPRNETVLGASRTMRNEQIGLDLRVLHIQESDVLQSTQLVDHIWKVAMSNGQDTEFLLSRGAVQIARISEDQAMNEMIAGHSGLTQPKLIRLGDADMPLRLSVGAPGLLDTLFFEADPDAQDALGPSAVEIAVKAVGLNFRDVMVAMGQIPDAALGYEASGIISKVGPAVTRFKVGDRVSTIGKSTFRTVLRIQESQPQLMPEGMSFQDAASLPLISCTIVQSLARIARLRKGQTILIHSAAGGVGQAAIQLAQHFEAEIFATVSSDEKKTLIMETYGIPEDHIMQSRDLSFSKGIMRMTNGRGVDVVLNSLSGEALRETWNCIAPFGTFVEIGIKDILNNTGLDMLPFLRDTTVASVNLEHIGRANPSLMAEIMDETFRFIAAGAIRPVTPLMTYSSTDLIDAFRLMQTGQHKGKIVITLNDDDFLSIKADHSHPLNLEGKGTILLVGGLGGLGRSIAQFLVSNKARHLAFISRSGATSPDQKIFLADLRSQEGIDARVFQCDIADESALRSTISQITAEMPKITGVISGAMALHDSIFANMTHTQWTAALQPKVTGSWNLHKLLPEDLSFFVLLSSQVGVYGNRGQSNYAAGCTFQDALCRYRRSKGLAAVSLDLGIMLGIGYIAEAGGFDALRDWECFGVNETELHCLIKAAVSGHSLRDVPVPAQIITGLATGGGVERARIPTPYYFDNPQMAIMAKTDLIRGGPDMTSTTASLSTALAATTSLADATSVVLEALTARVAKSLRTEAANIIADRPLYVYGVDSLVAVELRNWVGRECGADISLFEITSDVPMTKLAQQIAGRSKFVSKEEGTGAKGIS